MAKLLSLGAALAIEASYARDDAEGTNGAFYGCSVGGIRRGALPMLSGRDSASLGSEEDEMIARIDEAKNNDSPAGMTFGEVMRLMNTRTRALETAGEDDDTDDIDGADDLYNEDLFALTVMDLVHPDDIRDATDDEILPKRISCRKEIVMSTRELGVRLYVRRLPRGLRTRWNPETKRPDVIRRPRCESWKTARKDRRQHDHRSNYAAA